MTPETPGDNNRYLKAFKKKQETPKGQGANFDTKI